MGVVEARERWGSRQGRTPRVSDPAVPRQPGACVQTSVPSGRRTVGRGVLGAAEYAPEWTNHAPPGLVSALLRLSGREGVRPHPAAGGAVTRAASLAVPVLVLPALVLSLAVVLAVARPHPDWLAATVRVAPLVVFVGGSVLGFFLRRGRFVLELAGLAASLERPLVTTNLGAWTALPQLALAAFGAALCLILARFLTDRRPFSAGAAWALVASFLALDGASVNGLATLYFVTAGLLLVIGAAWGPPRVVGLDDVTGLPTSFALNKALLRLPRHYALARVEIDEFATFREHHGADAARRMLRLTAEALTKVGGRGHPFYCGAYTFAVVFRRTSAQAASHHLDVVRHVVERSTRAVRVPQRPPAGQPGRVGTVERTVAATISVGVAQPQGRRADPHEVLRAADLALDRAKQGGQNRVSA